MGKPLQPTNGLRVRWRRERGTIVWCQTDEVFDDLAGLTQALPNAVRDDLSTIGPYPAKMVSGPKATLDRENPRVLVRLDRRGPGGQVRYAWTPPSALRTV